jgi:hypothetical protein
LSEIALPVLGEPAPEPKEALTGEPKEASASA